MLFITSPKRDSKNLVTYYVPDSSHCCLWNINTYLFRHLQDPKTSKQKPTKMRKHFVNFVCLLLFFNILTVDVSVMVNLSTIVKRYTHKQSLYFVMFLLDLRE